MDGNSDVPNVGFWQRIFGKFIPSNAFWYTDHNLWLKTKIHCSGEKNINDLPYSVLIKIFSYLSMEDRVLDVSFVCTYWHQICKDSSFWVDIDFEDRKQLTDDILRRCISYCSYVNSVNLCDCYTKAVTDRGIIDLAKGCPNLTKINLAGTSHEITELAVMALVKYCPKLKHVEVDSLSLTDKTAICISKNLQDLEYLNLNNNTKITDRGTIPIIKFCPKLKTLKLNQIQGVTDETLMAIFENEIVEPKIEILCMSMCGISGKGVGLLFKFLNLKKFDLSRCKDLEFRHISNVLNNLRQVTYFCMCMQETINDECVRLAVTNFKDLAEIHLISTGITDKGMEYIAKHCKKLEVCDVGYTKVTHKGAKIVCESLPTLKKIHLTRCDQADDNEIELLAQRFPKIRFATFWQDAKRMLIRTGHWTEDDFGIVTKVDILDKMSLTPTGRLKPIRKMCAGGKLEYVPHHMEAAEGTMITPNTTEV